MKLVLDQMVMSSILLRCLGLVATDSSSGSDSMSTSSGESSSDDRLETVSESSGEEEPDSVERLRLKLDRQKKDILAQIDDEEFEFTDQNMRGHIEALRRDFLDALTESKLYPSLDEDTKARILGMSSEGFKKAFGERYDGRETRGRLASKIERAEERCRRYAPGGRDPNEEKASVHRERLEALKAALEEHEEKRREDRIRLQVCGDCREKVESLSCRVLGESSIPALYGSYLACERSLRTAETAGSSQEPDYQGCMVCIGSFEPGEEEIGCVNGHRFHEKCLYKWCVLGKETCPTCRGVFAEDQQSKLARCRSRYKDWMRSLYSIPDFEKKYMRRGKPIERGKNEADLLKAMCSEIRGCTSGLKSHPAYATVFNSPESSVYGQFYIPQDIVVYFENTEVGHHDPRSKGFARHKAVMIKHILDYKKQLDASTHLDTEERRVPLDRDIVQPLHSMLNMFCAVDSLLEYLYTRLHRIRDPDEKRSAIMSNQRTYPALHSSVSRCPDRTLEQVYRALGLIVNNFFLPSSVVVYSPQWLLAVSETFSEVFSEMVSEI